MFYSLPIETKLDILKFLSYEELWSVNETNLYFRDFISKYEDELAQEEFYKISFDCVNKFEKDPRRLIKLKTKNFDFPVNEQFEEIWKHGQEKLIPLYLPNQNSDSNIVICLSQAYDIEDQCLLQLPTIIKSKEDLKIVYYYLDRLFNCSFEKCLIEEYLRICCYGVPYNLYFRRFVLKQRCFV